MTWWPFIPLALLSASYLPLMRSQPVTEPAVRWLAGGTVLGPNLLAFSADGTLYYTHAAADEGLKTWDAATGQLLSLTPIPTRVTSVAALAHDEKHLAFIAPDQHLFLCRITDGAPAWDQRLQPAPFPTRLCFSTQDSLLLGLTLFQPLQLWQTSSGEASTVRFLDAFGAETTSLVWAGFVSDVEFLALGDTEAVRFNALTGEALWRKTDPALDWPYVAALSPDRSEYCTLTTNGLCRYSTTTGNRMGDLTVPSANITAMAYAPDGTRLAVALTSRVVEIRAVNDGSWQRELTGLPDPEGDIHTLAWSPDGQRIIAGGTYGGYVWSVDDGTSAQPLIPLIQAQATPAQFSSDAQWVVGGSWPHEVVLLHTADGTVAHCWSAGPEARVRYLRTSPSQPQVYVPTSDGNLQVHSLPDGALSDTVSLSPGSSGTLELEVSQDGSRLLALDRSAAAGGEFAVFSTRTWQPLRTELGNFITARFTADGGHVLTPSGDETLIWEADGDSEPQRVPTQGSPLLAAAPDEFWSLGREGLVERWRLTDGTRLHSFSLPMTDYTAVLSPDERLLLTSGRDPPLRIWRTEDGALVGMLGGPAGLPLARWTTAPDQRWLVATRRDGSWLALDHPFFLGLSPIAPKSVRFAVTGAPGPFQLESSTQLGNGWKSVGAPFEGESVLPQEPESAGFFRVVRAAQP